MPVSRKRPLPQEPRITGLKVDHEAIYEAVDRERRRRNMRYYEVAATLGVSPPTVTGWGHGIGFSVNHLARALTWLDRPLSDFTTTEPAEPRPVAQDDAA